MIPKDAMSMENYKRWERDLPLLKEPKPKHEEPAFPVVADEIKFQDIPDKEIRNFSARRRSERCPTGQIFCGWSVLVEFTDGKSITGWMGEAGFEQLKRRIPKERTDLLGKIGW